MAGASWSRERIISREGGGGERQWEMYVAFVAGLRKEKRDLLLVAIHPLTLARSFHSCRLWNATRRPLRGPKKNNERQKNERKKRRKNNKTNRNDYGERRVQRWSRRAGIA
ncbi:hypothetical protein ANTPLA_LOCUS2614 [Anthophora plagiata]